MRWILCLVLLQATTLDAPASVPRVSMEDVCLSHVIVKEAQSQGLVGMRSVLDSVLYRMKVRKKDACSVITEKFQYSWYRQGDKLKYNEKLLRILARVRMMKPVVVRADFFHSEMAERPNWSREYRYRGKIAGHYFYDSQS